MRSYGFKWTIAHSQRCLFSNCWVLTLTLWLEHIQRWKRNDLSWAVQLSSRLGRVDLVVGMLEDFRDDVRVWQIIYEWVTFYPKEGKAFEELRISQNANIEEATTSGARGIVKLAGTSWWLDVMGHLRSMLAYNKVHRTKTQHILSYQKVGGTSDAPISREHFLGFCICTCLTYL